MTHNCRMGWLPNAQMIADGMPDAPKAKPPALMRRPATEFKGECFDARDMAHPAAKTVSAPTMPRTHVINVNTGVSLVREAAEAAVMKALARSARRSADDQFTPPQSQPRKPDRDGIAAYFGLNLTEPAAPKADAEGWIEWKGGECPAPVGAKCELLFRGGRKVRPSLEAQELCWHHVGVPGFDDGDIVAYRVLP